MARTFGAVRDYAPYLFLATGTGSNEYRLFVAIPHASGKRVDYDNNLTYTNGTTMLSFTVVDDNTVTSAAKKYKGIDLNPDQAAKNNGYTFNAASFSIQVDTYRTEVVGGQTVQITQSIKVYYDTADSNTPTTNDKATDCPYIYLTNPNAETENGDRKFTPFCLVPLGSYEEDTQNYNNSVGGVAGNCLQEIYLKSPLPSGKTEIAPGNITANTEAYTDPDPVNGYFEVILYYPGQPSTPANRRKVKMKSQSSDQHQSSFID